VSSPQLEANKATTREFFALLTKGDVHAAVALIADEGEFWQAGSDGPGRILTLPELKSMFVTVIGGLPHGIVFDVGQMIAEGNWVVADVNCDGELANGNRYRNRYCFHFEIVDGVIVSGREYMDTMHAAKAFANS
jgi:ketosteroid isomerase-like protein